MFNLDKYFAREKIENGILSIVLHSMLIECTDVNCVGPPNGNELKLFLAKDIVFKWTKLDSSPSWKRALRSAVNKYREQRTGSWETLLPSILNSSSLEQLASDDGMADRRLYLIKSRLRFFRFPINSGKSISSLWVKSRVVNWAQLPKKTNNNVEIRSNAEVSRSLPISLGRCSRWLWATSSVNNWIRWPTVTGRERIRFSRKLNICKF